MKKHCFNPRFRYSVAAVPITSITPRQTKSKSNRQPRLESLLLGLDFGATHQPIDVFIKFLRSKVDMPGLPKLIHTERGLGYSLRQETI